MENYYYNIIIHSKKQQIFFPQQKIYIEQSKLNTHLSKQISRYDVLKKQSLLIYTLKKLKRMQKQQYACTQTSKHNKIYISIYTYHKVHTSVNAQVQNASCTLTKIFLTMSQPQVSKS
eukprot:TRINITY_DN13183_c0_g3_i1.p4 TRINITY_DN13183_c0_g3~~TRINITY_DN13183_c0_g3_i1.p4  ORF type:complete len:118 (-),score=0.39 TRINITY_DN13183_c0_g3_i1:1181-1534(-)